MDKIYVQREDGKLREIEPYNGPTVIVWMIAATIVWGAMIGVALWVLA